MPWLQMVHVFPLLGVLWLAFHSEWNSNLQGPDAIGRGVTDQEPQETSVVWDIHLLHGAESTAGIVWHGC